MTTRSDNSVDEAVILAAGRGSRLGSLTQQTPKPMLTWQGKPILEHNVEWCQRNGIRQLLINVSHHGEIIMDHFGDGWRWGVSIRYKIETQLLGTAGGVRSFLPDIRQPSFFVIYGDNWIEYDLAQMARQHQRTGAEMTIAVFELSDVRTSGVVEMDSTDRILSFKEKPATNQPGWVNMGVYVMEKALAAQIPEGTLDFGRDVIPRWIHEGRRIWGARMDKPVGAIDTPELYEKRSRASGH